MFDQHLYSPHRKKSGGRKIAAFGLLILALAVALGILGALYWSLHRPQNSSAALVPIHVGLGDNVTTVADRLDRKGLIHNALLFRIDARLHGLASKLKVGDYHLRRNMSIDEMVGAFSVYRSPTVRMTIPEGLRLEQIADIVQRYGINRRNFIRQVEYPTLQSPILQDRPAGKSLEGYLFPNTYDVPPHYGARDLVKLMVQTLERKFTPSMRAEAARRGLTVYQVLTLASIIEREAKAPSERPIIASVYTNRLKTPGMVLNADPTIQFAIGTRQNWWPLLTTAELHVDSPYNTYVHAGLPPGPIDSPGLASITATIRPATTPFFFFVAKNDCRHHAFSRTLAGQEANQQRYSCGT